jgi:hypothetical protein
MRFNRLGIMLAAGMAMVVFSALAASVAQAEEIKGPLWIVGSPGRGLLTGETRSITSRSEGIYKLKTVGSPAVECNKVLNAGVLLGGSPGTAYTTITFKECHLEGHEKCLASGEKPLASPVNSGEVIVDALAVLVYPEGSTRSALLAFAPEGEPADTALFAEFKLLNQGEERGEVGECGKLNEKKLEVNATGSVIKVKSEERRCGQLAQVGHTVEGDFVLSQPGEKARVGLLQLPSEVITKAEWWNGEKYEKIECKLESKGGFAGKASEVGTSIIETIPAEEFGWNL